MLTAHFNPKINNFLLLCLKVKYRPHQILENIYFKVFQQLKKQNPDVLKKLVPIEGDITVENLGISEENIKILHSEVSVVFHFAATLRLEAVLKESVKHNLYGTDYMFKLSTGIKKLEVLINYFFVIISSDNQKTIYP